MCLESVETGSRRRLERNPDRTDVIDSHVGKLLRRDEDSIEFVISDENVPCRFTILLDAQISD